jgi:hypothetical protein
MTLEEFFLRCSGGEFTSHVDAESMRTVVRLQATDGGGLQLELQIIAGNVVTVVAPAAKEA